ncbi:MAG: hypothetical protein ACI4KA_07080, partial [Oscillospiraceae bacterium]
MKVKKIIKRILSVALAAAFCFSAAGCTNNSSGGQNTVVNVTQPGSEDGGSVTRAYQPIKKEDGSKFKLAYVDIDPYPETFKMLYYVIESLKADGWISYDELPFDPETGEDSLALMNWLSDNAESEYIEFDKSAFYYTTVSTEEEIYASLREHIEVAKDIDAILTMGTSPSVMVQGFDFDVP